MIIITYILQLFRLEKKKGLYSTRAKLKKDAIVETQRKDSRICLLKSLKHTIARVQRQTRNITYSIPFNTSSRAGNGVVLHIRWRSFASLHYVVP